MSKRNNLKPISIVLVALILIWVLIKVKEKQGDRSFKALVVQVDTSKVETITIIPKKSKDELMMDKENGIWMIDLNGKKVQADGNSIDDLIGQIARLKPKRVAATSKDKWGEYEVTDTTATRIIVNKGKNPLADILIGKFAYDQQTRQMTSFLRNYDEDITYGVDGYLSVMFNRNASSFRDNAIINGNPENWKKLTYTYPADSSFILEKQDNKWLVNGMPTDSLAVDKYFSKIRILSDNSFDDSVDYNMNAFSDFTLQIEGDHFSPITVKGILNNSGKLEVMSSINKGNVILSDKVRNVLFTGKETFLKK